MKKAKKVVALALCAVMLVVGSVAGTMAYLTSQDAVTNTFTVGNVAIILDETDVDESATNVTTEGRDKANAYKLMPGHKYDKDPIIHVASGSEDSYLFVKVVNEIAQIEDSANTIAAQLAANGWKAVDGKTGVYVYATGEETKTIVSANADKTVFTEFKVADGVNNTTLAAYANKTVVVTAYAVQADGFAGKTPAEIWTAAGFN